MTLESKVRVKYVLNMSFFNCVTQRGECLFSYFDGAGSYLAILYCIVLIVFIYCVIVSKVSDHQYDLEVKVISLKICLRLVF